VIWVAADAIVPLNAERFSGSGGKMPILADVARLPHTYASRAVDERVLGWLTAKRARTAQWETPWLSWRGTDKGL
jgi:hypothetical protein